MSDDFIVRCPYCGAETDLTDSAEVYGNSVEFKSGSFDERKQAIAAAVNAVMSEVE